MPPALRAARFSALAAVLIALPVVAQQPAVRDLPTATREIDDPFSSVASALVVKPGQVLVVDGTELEVSLVNFSTGARQAVGRQGAGPGEYRAPAGLFRLTGDTIWLVDAGQQRLVSFNPDLTPGTTVPLMFFDQSSMTAISVPFLSDRQGHLYASAMPVQIGRGGGGAQVSIPDSVAVVRMDPRDANARTELARVRFPTSGKPEVQQLSQTSIKMTMAYPGLVASDPWTVFPDGRIAIVRGATYAVEFITPSGKASAPVRVAWEPIKVTEADRKAEMDEAQKQLREQSKTMQKMMPPNIQMQFELLPPAEWPATYPAVAALGLLPAPDGRLWVKRATPIRVGREQWDVLDASGKVVARWRLPAKTTIVAVGDGVVYAVRTDEDDLRYLQQVAIPK